MTKSEISYDEYLRAQGLFHLANEHYKKGQEFEAALSELLGYDEVYCGHISDQLFDGGGSLDKGLKGEKIEVVVKD